MLTRPRGIRRTVLKARPLVAAAAVALALATAACGSDSGGGGGSESGGGGGPSADQLDEIQQLVDTAQEAPTYEDPGPPVDLTSLAGQKVMVIPTASQL